MQVQESKPLPAEEVFNLLTFMYSHHMTVAINVPNRIIIGLKKFSLTTGGSSHLQKVFANMLRARSTDIS